MSIEEGREHTVEDRLLTTREAATKFRVHPTTIRRWVADGFLKAAPTPGRHGRYWESDVKAAMTKDTDPAEGDALMNADAASEASA